MKMVVLAAAVLGIGCGDKGSDDVGIDPVRSQPDPMGETDIIARVWSEVYGSPGPLPRLRWLTGESLDCLGGYGYRIGSECWLGHYSESVDVATIARPAGIRLSGTSLSHELSHAEMFRRTGSPDSYHSTPEFHVLTERGTRFLAASGF